MLIVENLHTYHSLVTWNSKAKRYRSVAYGSGAGVTRAPQAVLSAAERSGSAGIAYFGDLDQEGLDIAMLLLRRLAAMSGVVMVPATDLYRQLLQYGVRRLTDQPQAVSEACEAWLGAELAGQVRSLFSRHAWMPQEGLSLERLMSGGDEVWSSVA
ncbi:Wadjet anti-phage system protein JetD domain-containing protein [Cupriavidus basilensis]